MKQYFTSIADVCNDGMKTISSPIASDTDARHLMRLDNILHLALAGEGMDPLEDFEFDAEHDGCEGCEVLNVPVIRDKRLMFYTEVGGAESAMSFCESSLRAIADNLANQGSKEEDEEE